MDKICNNITMFIKIERICDLKKRTFELGTKTFVLEEVQVILNEGHVS